MALSRAGLIRWMDWLSCLQREATKCTIILSVAVSKLQVAILARLSREMSQTVRKD